MNYTQAQIDRANAVSLEDFLRTQGETLIKSGREYRWKEHDSLTVRGNKWFRHSQSKGGYPIDFVMEFYGKSFPEAVQMLTGENGEGQTEATTAPPTAFHLPLHNRTADRAIQYLCESRMLVKAGRILNIGVALLKYYAELNLNQSGQYGQIYAEKFTSVSLICKVFYGKMKAQ